MILQLSIILGHKDLRVQNDACCDETNLNKANDAKLVVVGVLEEMVEPMKVYQWDHADSHPVHPFGAPGHPLVKQELASSGEDPNPREHDLVCGHMIESTGLNSHGNHFEEDLKHFSCKKQDKSVRALVITMDPF